MSVTTSRAKGPAVSNAYVARNETMAESESASRVMAKMTPISVGPLMPGGGMNTTIDIAALPGVHMWVSDVREATSVRLLSVEDRQLIYFPGEGEIAVETTRGTFVANCENGVSVEAATVVEVRVFAGRIGVGIAIDRTELTRRLFNILGQPVMRRLEFADQFRAGIRHQAAVEEMIRSVASRDLGSALTEWPVAAASMSDTVIDLVLQSIPHNYSDQLEKASHVVFPRHIKQAKKQIDDDPRLKLSVEDLAQICGVSSRTLQYGFHQYLNTSVTEYIRMARLEGARKAMLSSADRALTEISEEWGFSNVSRFSAYFLAVYGETPKAFRARRERDRTM